MIGAMIRSMFAVFLMGLALPALALADAPTSRPALKIAVLPFDVMGPSGHEWLGRAMQDGLATGLQNQLGIQTVIASVVAPLDSAAAMETAKTVNADLVIFGGIQVVDNQIRINGQMMWVGAGQSVGVLRSEGDERDLFNLEDSLANRALRLLTSPASTHRTNSGPALTLDIVGPAMPSTITKYFDGNLGNILTPPAKYRDDYDRYYYHSASSDACASYYGYGCAYGCGYGCGFPTGSYAAPVTPISGW